MSGKSTALYKLTGSIALVGLNAAFAAFFILWSIADTAAMDAMEASTGFDPVSMLPNANWMWASACASLILLVVVDACAIALYLQSRNKSETVKLAPVSQHSRTP